MQTPVKPDRCIFLLFMYLCLYSLLCVLYSILLLLFIYNYYFFVCFIFRSRDCHIIQFKIFNNFDLFILLLHTTNIHTCNAFVYNIKCYKIHLTVLSTLCT
uniref:Uncharacterized protein n=1 Tax=Sipha flava TaxID=143950 RepID=A0A2S2QST8_9HEMI